MVDAIDIAEDILRKKNLDQWEIFRQKSSSFRCQTKKLETDFFQKADISGIAVRLVKNGKIGFSFSSNLDAKSLAQTIETADAIADVTIEDSDYGFIQPTDSKVESSGLFHPEINEMKELDKIGIARIIEESAFAYDKKVTSIRSSGYSDVELDVEIRNSHGLRIQGKSGLASIWIELMAQTGDEQEMCYWRYQSRNPRDLDPVRLAQIASDRAIKRLGGERISSTKCPVLIENVVVASFLETLANSFLAESHFKKTASPRITIGADVFSPLVNIFDSGLDADGAYAFPFDGEGTPARRTAVVGSGRINSFLSDSYYGRKMKAPITGNCRRSGFDSPPFNGITNLFIQKGNLEIGDLMKELNSGIMITEVMGLHTANPITGDFSVGASGFLISGGQIVHPVKGIAIAGNMLDLFKRVIFLGSDFEFFGNVGAPSMVVEILAVSGQ